MPLHRVKRKPQTIRIPVRFDDPRIHYDMPGLRFDSEFVEITVNPMSQIVLNLASLTDDQVAQFARDLGAGLTTNAADFTGITPTAADLTAAGNLFGTQISENADAQQAAIASTVMKNDGRTVCEGVIRAAAGWTENNVTDPMTVSKVFTLQKAATPTTSIGQVMSLNATFGDKPSEVDLGWDPVAAAKSYEIQTKLPGADWTHARTVGKSSGTVKGLPSAQVVQFRVRAIGPNDLEGPWSDAAEHLVP